MQIIKVSQSLVIFQEEDKQAILNISENKGYVNYINMHSNTPIKYNSFIDSLFLYRAATEITKYCNDFGIELWT